MKISIVVLFIGMFCLGCTRHHADNLTSAPTGIHHTLTLTDSLYGSWKLDKVDVQSPPNTISDSAMLARRDAMLQNFKGGIIVLDTGSRYKLTVDGRDDSGTWKVDDQRQIHGTSVGMNMNAAFEVVSVTNSNMVVKYSGSDMTVLLSFVRIT